LQFDNLQQKVTVDVFAVVLAAHRAKKKKRIIITREFREDDLLEGAALLATVLTEDW
jgi:hypothetical protein